MWMVKQALFFVGRGIRESGQALDRLGCRVQGNFSFREECMLEESSYLQYKYTLFVYIYLFLVTSISSQKNYAFI